MLLYHYRSIDSALLEIGNGTFHFSSCEELNDPIEGYIRVFWKGDKAAWEGMFRNYVCSVSHAINMYLLRGDEEILHHQTLIIDLNYYDNGQHGQAFKELGNGFLGDEEIQRLAAFYGNNRLKVYEKELKLVFNFIHNKALTLCIRKCLDYGTMPEEMANNLLKMFQSKAFLFPFDLLESELDDEEHRSKITKDAEDAIEDICDLQYVRLGFDDDTFLYGKRKDESGQIIKENAITEARQRRNWMAIAVDFPKVYVEQMKEMIYPESYVVCFSEKNNDSSMWGNYADCHKGVCLIYEMDEKNSITFRGDGVTVPLDVKPVSYQGKTIECNFFETFGRLTRKQIETWLTGVYDISNVYDAFSDEDNWRSRYWEAFETKTYRKLKAWEHENEYRLVLTNQVYRFNDSKNRNLQYDPQMLKGLIFGINTSEYDKKRLMEKLNKYANELEEFAFYQAEYDDEAQSIRVRKKVRWEI